MTQKTLQITLGILLLISVAFAQEIKEEDVINSLMDLKAEAKTMEKEGISTTLIRDIIIEAERELYGENLSKLITQAEGINQTKKREEIEQVIKTLESAMKERKVDYNLVISRIEQAQEIEKKAYEIRDQLSSLKLKLESTDPTININEEKDMHKEAETLFKDELYTEAEQKITETFNSANRKEAEATELRLLYTAGREKISVYLKENWKAILLTILILSAVFSLAWWRLSIMLTKNKIKRLELEKVVLIRLIKDTQKDRFEDGDITKEEYDIKTESYKERILDIDKELPILVEKLDKQKKKEEEKAKKEEEIKTRLAEEEKRRARELEEKKERKKKIQHALSLIKSVFTKTTSKIKELQKKRAEITRKMEAQQAGEVLKLIGEADAFLKIKNKARAKEAYTQLRHKYKKLSWKNKKTLGPKILKLHKQLSQK